MTFAYTHHQAWRTFALDALNTAVAVAAAAEALSDEPAGDVLHENTASCCVVLVVAAGQPRNVAGVVGIVATGCIFILKMVRCGMVWLFLEEA